jgi:hypothetical protein
VENGEYKNSEVGLRPVGTIGAIGAIGAYAPEGSRKKAKPMEPDNKLIKQSVF